MTLVDFGHGDTAVVVQLVATQYAVDDGALIARMSTLAAYKLCERESKGDFGGGILARLVEEIFWYLLDQYYDHIVGFKQQLRSPGEGLTEEAEP